MGHCSFVCAQIKTIRSGLGAVLLPVLEFFLPHASTPALCPRIKRCMLTFKAHRLGQIIRCTGLKCPHLLLGRSREKTRQEMNFSLLEEQAFHPHAETGCREKAHPMWGWRFFKNFFRATEIPCNCDDRICKTRSRKSRGASTSSLLSMMRSMGGFKLRFWNGLGAYFISEREKERHRT